MSLPGKRKSKKYGEVVQKSGGWRLSCVGGTASGNTRVIAQHATGTEETESGEEGVGGPVKMKELEGNVME